MAKINFKNSIEISDFGKPYFVAEMNTSHFGNIETAKKMIEEAKNSNCNCVKFQSWTTDTLYSKSYYVKNPIAKRFVKGFSFSEEQLAELALYCKKIGIDFSSTPYSKLEVDFLINKCNVPFIKIASMDLTNHPFIQYIAQTGTPIVLSTGMGEIDEIRSAINIIEETGNKNICLLHCISIYPPELSTIRLNNILGLREEFLNYPIGFSDHSLGIEIPTAAIALGACLIEKHFTLDKTKIGMDNQIALEPDEMTQMVKNCNSVHLALGDTKKIVLEAELNKRKVMRRSIITSRYLKVGTILKEDDLDAKRPGDGISPDKIKDLIGKVLLKDIEEDTIISEDDFK